MRFGIIPLFLVALTAWVMWLGHRDPLASLPQPENILQTDIVPLALQQTHRRIEHITLHTAKLGDIGLAVSLPDPLPSKKLPLLIVLGGLGSGENNIRYVTDAGNNAVVGYDWPMPPRFYSGPVFIGQMPEAYSHLMTIPGQVTSGIEWLQQQPWADSNRVSILGFSLGALAAPSIQDVAQHSGIGIGWTIIAYGGSPFGALFTANPHIKPEAMRLMLAPMIDLLLQPLQPTQHLPHLSGHFLVLEGENDALIPAAARTDLRNAVPEPKTIVTFPGTHMGVGPDKMELLRKIIDTSKIWLFQNGAVNNP